MTIIELAKQAGLDWQSGWTLEDGEPNRFEHFANLIAAHEREACAKVCDDYDVKYDVNTCDTAEGIALEIRARGTT